jgi:hypothetical protein
MKSRSTLRNGYDAFISHSHVDKAWARDLVERLAKVDFRGRSLRAWLDGSTSTSSIRRSCSGSGVDVGARPIADALGVATTAFLLLKGTLASSWAATRRPLLSSTNPTSRIPRRPKV